MMLTTTTTKSNSIAILSLITLLSPLTAAQRAGNISICDYYTPLLLKTNTAANQYTLLTLLVNTAVIGNYTTPNVGVSVPGILAPGTVNGTAVNLLPYFDGGRASSNREGSAGVAVNFLDDGGAAPLEANMPSNGTGSNQLFMDIDIAQITYFITQVGLSATSFGVAPADVTEVGTLLTKLFAYRCTAPVAVLPNEAPELQSICIADDCPTAPNSTCSAYSAAVEPGVANTTLAAGLGSNSTSSAGASGVSSGSAGASATGTGSGTGNGNGTASPTAAVKGTGSPIITSGAGKLWGLGVGGLVFVVAALLF
ncbi:hypothetical protein MMC25_005275 [Agyrium rufum]|nr:hypothetical protein [Agyrium rufum]